MLVLGHWCSRSAALGSLNPVLQTRVQSSRCVSVSFCLFWNTGAVSARASATPRPSPQTQGDMRTIGDLHPTQVHKRRMICAQLGTYTPLIRPAFVNRDAGRPSLSKATPNCHACVNRDEGRPSLLRLEVPRTFNLSKLGELKKPKATYML